MFGRKFTIITTVVALATIGTVWSLNGHVGNGAGPNEGKVPSALLTPQTRTSEPSASTSATSASGKAAEYAEKAKGWLSKVQQNLDDWANSDSSVGAGTATSTEIGGAWNGVTYTAADAEQHITTLTVAPAGTMAGYSRDRFTHWISSPLGSGCDTRDAILYRDATGGARGANCTITGTWVDPYTGETSTTAHDFDIDHVVPLAAAWRAGANTWTDAQREHYANDNLVLLTTGSSPNREKGDRTADQWKPVNRADWCSYAVRTVEIKTTYKLSVTNSEKSALDGMLDTCPA